MTARTRAHLGLLLAAAVAAAGACTESGSAVVTDAGANDATAAKDGAPVVDAASFEDGSFDTACVTETRNATPPPAYLQLVLDGSNSMAGGKWGAMSSAVLAYVDELLVKNDPSLGLGVMVFSDTLDPSNGTGPYPTAKDSPPRAVDQAVHDALRGRLETASPSGPSSVFTALRGGYALLESMIVSPPLVAGGRKAALLVADGPPSDDPSFQGAIDLVGEKRDTAKIRTFSLGLGPFPQAEGYSSDFMGDIAVAGGTAPNPQCNPHTNTLTDICHIQVTPGARTGDAVKADILKALRRVHASVSACELTVAGGAPPDAARVNLVWVDGEKREHLLAQGPVDGWTVDPASPDRVLLHGRTCGDVTASDGSEIRVLLGCTTRLGK